MTGDAGVCICVESDIGLSTTAGLIERLAVDRALRRICGFPMRKKLRDESTFSRVFAQFVTYGLAERTCAALVRETLGEQLDRPYQLGWYGHRGPGETGAEVKAAREQSVAKKRGRLSSCIR